MEQSSSILNPNPNPNNPNNPNAYTLDSPHPVYAMAFSTSTSSPFRLALGSFLEEYNNRVDIVTFDEDSTSFRAEPSLSFDHPYPATKLMFHPRPVAGGSGSSLIASSGDFLRLWQVQHDVDGGDGGKTELRSVMNNSKSSDFCAPLTSFDWNDAEPRRIGTSSIDTTCTVWDIERGAVETQLIAHDKEVYDIAWGEAGVFASVSADGSVRIFDLRDKEHSTIVYESPRPDTPLLRLSWNKSDLRYMAALQMDSSRVILLDIRAPAFPVAELQRHRACVNALAWAPRAPRSLCSVGDDGQALIWDVPTAAAAGAPGTGTGRMVYPPPNGGDLDLDPVLSYSVGAEINQLQWAAAHPDWIGIAFANKVQLLRV